MKKSLLVLVAGLALSSQAQMTMTTSAMFGDCNCYTLTTGTNDKGAIWSPAMIDLTQNFDMTFQIYGGAADGEADGMAFVLQQNPTGIGDVGNTLGYRDIAPLSVPPISVKSFAIEVDLWDSNPAVVTDIPSDHIGVESNNSNEHNLAGPYPITNMEDGAYHAFRVIWVSSMQTMTVFLDGNFVFVYNADIVTNIFTGNPNVYFGWTAATGGVPGNHRVCMYRNAQFTQDVTSVCPDVPVNFTDNSLSDLNNILTYTWDFGDGSPIDNSQDPAHAYTTPGTYTAKLYITDISGCDDSAQVNITVLPDLIVNVAGTDPQCYGDPYGQATATPTNGTGPYTYLWDDALTQTTQTAIDLAPNATYNVSVEDALGCVGSGTVTLTEPLEIIVDVHAADVSCYGGNDGEATAVVINGVGAITYLWNDPAAQTNSQALGLTAGTYVVVATDANGCTGTDTIDIIEPSQIFITGVVTYDNGTSNGAVDATIGGGTPPYTSTLWSNSATTEDISGLVSGDYTLTVTDAEGCMYDTTFVIKSSVGLADLAQGGFDIYPNPTDGLFQIKGLGHYLVTVTDVAGRVVYTITASDNEAIDMDFAEKGVYFVHIDQNGIRYTERLVLH